MTPEQIATARDSRALSDIVQNYGVRLHRMGRVLKGLCPFHDEKSPSFHVRDDRGTYKCFGCGAWGDAIDFIMQTQSIGFIEAVKQLNGGDVSLGRRLEHRKAKGDIEEDEARRIKYAHALWLKRAPITHTIAENYLRQARRISAMIPDALGFVEGAYCSVTRREEPALIAPIQDSNGHVTAVQAVFLSFKTFDAIRDERGRRIKRTFGCMRDGAVRLGTPQHVMGVAGSVEDALSAMQLYSIPTWAACGEARMGHVWLPDEVEHLIIFADADEAGHREAQKAAREHAQKIMRVEITYPDQGKDMNEQIVREALG